MANANSRSAAVISAAMHNMSTVINLKNDIGLTYEVRSPLQTWIPLVLRAFPTVGTIAFRRLFLFRIKFVAMCSTTKGMLANRFAFALWILVKKRLTCVLLALLSVLIVAWSEDDFVISIKG